MVWTDSILKKLKSYYEKGLSTSEIGTKLGFSKNAIVGKINRLGWNLSKTTKKKPTKTTKPKTKKETKKKLSARDIAIQHALSLSNLKADQCRWPIGEPGSEKFHFCGEKAFQGKPYCFEHCMQAYSLAKPSDLKKRV